VGSASPEAIALSLSTVNPEESRDLFEYDPTAPLDIQEERRWVEDGATWIDFTYASPVEGPGVRVPARLVIPAGQGPFPGMILMHGGPGTLEDMDGFARAFTHYGAVTIAITSPYRRPGGWEITQYMGNTWPIFNYRDVEIKIQLILDLRRAIDILADRPEVDSDRLAYFGVSWGASMGGLLAGVEDRITAYVLAAGDGGLVEHTADPGPDGLNIHFSQRWATYMWPTEPLHFVGRAAPAALLFQNGINDTYVPPHDALRFYTAASEPKTMIWYEAGHELPWSFVEDAAEWLQPYLGDHLILLGPNFRPNAVIADRALLAAGMLPLAVFLVYTIRRRTFNLAESWFWLPAVFFLGPFGLGLYGLANPAKDDQLQKAAHSKWRTTLLFSIRATIALLAGVWVGETINQNFLLGVDFRLRFLQSYLAVLLIGWFLSWLGRRHWWNSFQAHLLVANVFWVLELFLPAVYWEFFPYATWARFPLTTVIGILITFPLYVWLLRNGWAAPVDSSKVQPSESRSRLALAILLIVSFAVVLTGVVLIIHRYSGLTIEESVRFLLGLTS
jgi:dienelactone hydrolase